MTEPQQETRDASEIGYDAARSAWAEAARPVLVAAAERYRATVKWKLLAEAVQRDSGVTTAQPMHRWIGGVLDRVAADCQSRGEPLLPALCISMQGAVSEGYADAVERARGVRPADPDGQAAEERLECYRHWNAEGLPRDGGTPLRTAHFTPARKAPARKAAAARTATPRTPAAPRKTAAPKPEPKPARLCPTCFTEVPASGVCDYCD